jgi:hypothetical protein
MEFRTLASKRKMLRRKSAAVKNRMPRASPPRSMLFPEIIIDSVVSSVISWFLSGQTRPAKVKNFFTCGS